MSLNTYPANPFPPSTDQMDADALEAEVSQLKSGLTNVQDDVKLNTQDLTTPSRSKNVINILDKASETINGVTAVCSGGVITLTGESSGGAEFYFSLGTPLVLDPTLYKIAFNNTAKNQYMAIRFRNSSATLLNWAPNVENRIVENWQDSVTCDRLSIAIPNGYFTEMTISITVLDKTETDTTFAPYIPSVESRLEALEAAIAQLTNS